MPYRDRTDAGQQLAARLSAFADRPDVIVLALPRGGVPVGFQVAQAPARAAGSIPGPQAGAAGA